MYIIINKTRNEQTILQGNFPNLDTLLDKGDKIVIYSQYSNTIKVPHLVEQHGQIEWVWEDYPLGSYHLTIKYTDV